MSFPFHPIAPTSDAGNAERGDEVGAKTFTGDDFSDEEDALPWWRAIALFGALLLVAGFILLKTFPNSGVLFGTTSLTRTPPMVIGAVALMVAAGLITALLSFGEESLAFFGAAAVLFSIPLAAPASDITNGFTSSAVGKVILGVTVGIGVLIFLGGVMGLARTYRAMGNEAPKRTSGAQGNSHN
jgi:hypothetical protein